MDEIYIGNELSLIVHAPDCDVVFKMNPCNHAVFDNLYDALGQGYDECNYCLGEGAKDYFQLDKIKKYVRAKSYNECLCCGETRGVQRAHIIPNRIGGTDVMPLCPTCHWNYDHGILNSGEHKKVSGWIKENKPKLHSHAQSVYLSLTGQKI